MSSDPKIGELSVRAFEVPTDAPESDGTLEWSSTTLVLVELQAGGETGLGYSYTDASVAALIRDKLAEIVTGRAALDIPAAWRAMVHETRNLGRAGLVSMGVAAVDAALWDLKGKLLGLPLSRLLGRARESVAIYGSGGFTSYDDARLSAQLGGWADDGLSMVKMKAGRDLARDPHRMEVGRQAIGPDVELFVDLNGATDRKGALAFAEVAADFDVHWLEEPVSSNDLEGLRLLRDRSPAGMRIAAGEYGFDAHYFRRMAAAGAVDVLQADATRCAGITGFLAAAEIARAFELPLSAHCAPALHLHPCLAAPTAIHVEWFHDHVRIEHLLFDGAPDPAAGRIAASDAPGLGLTLKEADASLFEIS